MINRFFLLIISLFTTNNIQGQNILDCNILKEIVQFEAVNTILSTKEVEINQIRFIIPDSINVKSEITPSNKEIVEIVQSFYPDSINVNYCPGGKIGNKNYSFSFTNFQFMYDFNTGLVREVVFQSYKKIRTNTYVLDLLFYEYGCHEIKTDIYSIEFLVKIDKENNYEVDLLNIGIVH